MLEIAVLVLVGVVLGGLVYRMARSARRSEMDAMSDDLLDSVDWNPPASGVSDFINRTDGYPIYTKNDQGEWIVIDKVLREDGGYSIVTRPSTEGEEEKSSLSSPIVIKSDRLKRVPAVAEKITVDSADCSPWLEENRNVDCP